MGRLQDVFQSDGHAKGHSNMYNLQYGGFNGYAPNLAEWVSGQNYKRANLITILLEAPKGFRYLDNPNAWTGALKSLLEVHPKTVEGLNAGLTVEVSETPVSGGGEMQQDPINVTRERSNPTITLTDKYGRPMQTLIHAWITDLIGDPDSKVPNIATLSGNKPTDLLADDYSATVLFFEPNTAMTQVTKAWLCTNFFPKTTGEIIGKRDLTTGADLLELSIEFTALTQTGTGVRLFAQDILNKMNFVNANPYLRPAFMNAVEADVAALTDRGYAAQANDLSNTAVNR